MSESVAPKSSLRKRLEHAVTLHVDAQSEECMDYLAHPDILVAEFCDSFLAAQEYDHREESFWAEGQKEIPRRRWVDHIVQRLIEQQTTRVPVEPAYAFRYMARQIIPLWSEHARRAENPSDRRSSGGLDYIGIVEEEEPRAVLGVVKPQDDDGPYLSFLRLITCLSEVATEAQMERANRFLFKGAIPGRPSIDLHIITVDPPETQHQLVGLTHDLAHQFGVLLREEWQFPNLIRSTALLALDTDAFDGTLRVVWSV